MRSIKELNIRNRTHYVFNDMNNIKNFDPDLIKTDKKWLKNSGIYYIEYITRKKVDDYENIYSANPLYTLKKVMEIGI